MSNEREKMREVFFAAWRKHQQQLLLEPLEAQLIEIILWHPEYHALLEDPENVGQQNFAEANPFLHLSLHLAIQEQVVTDRPKGIQKIHKKLCEKFGDRHIAEHHMMECLADLLWQAQQSGKAPDEQFYLEKLRGLV
jgi:hypothetical protein